MATTYVKTNCSRFRHNKPFVSKQQTPSPGLETDAKTKELSYNETRKSGLDEQELDLFRSTVNQRR